MRQQVEGKAERPITRTAAKIGPGDRKADRRTASPARARWCSPSSGLAGVAHSYPSAAPVMPATPPTEAM